jgi:predicted enzyme related to lactoylglutathione lyase
MGTALLRAVDCVQVPVRDLDEAIAFYRDSLGQPLVWRSEEAAGFALPDQPGAELVVQRMRPEPEADLLVLDVPAAVDRWVAAGGTVEVAPFDIAIGRCAVVRDPFGNRLVVVDMSRGPICAQDPA